MGQIVFLFPYVESSFDPGSAYVLNALTLEEEIGFRMYDVLETDFIHIPVAQGAKEVLARVGILKPTFITFEQINWTHAI